MGMGRNLSALFAGAAGSVDLGRTLLIAQSLKDSRLENRLTQAGIDKQQRSLVCTTNFPILAAVARATGRRVQCLR